MVVYDFWFRLEMSNKKEGELWCDNIREYLKKIIIRIEGILK